MMGYDARLQRFYLFDFPISLRYLMQPEQFYATGVMCKAVHQWSTRRFLSNSGRVGSELYPINGQFLSPNQRILTMINWVKCNM